MGLELQPQDQELHVPSTESVKSTRKAFFLIDVKLLNISFRYPT